MAEFQRPFDTESFTSTGHPVANQLFDPASMETFRSSPEHKSQLSKKRLSSRLEKETRRQKKEADRNKLHQEVKDRLHEELREHESIQAQMHAARDLISRKRADADKAERGLSELELKMSASSLKEDQLTMDLAKLQVELAAYRTKMRGVEEEQQRARQLTEELSNDRNKAKEEAQELREERRKAAEQRRLDDARREGLMQGKLEGMYAGWEDGKIQGYKDGRVNGSRHQYGKMRNRGWKAFERELSDDEELDGWIPPPDEAFTGEVPKALKQLEAPIIVPTAPKKQRRPAPPPATVYHNEDDVFYPQPVHSSPETMQRALPPAASSRGHSRLDQMETAPASTRTDRRPRERSRPRTALPPPQPVFSEDEEWQVPLSRPQELYRTTTQRAMDTLGGKFKRKPEEIQPAPEHMDFAPFAAPLPYPSVATPLPHSQTLQPGRAVPTPAPSVHRRDDNSDEELERVLRERRERRERDEDSHGRGGFLSRINSAIRGNAQHPPIDPSNHPLAYQEAQPTPHLSRLDVRTPSASPQGSPSMRGAPQWPPPASPRHARPEIQDVFVPALDASGKFTLPPPHELGGSAMESAINMSLSQNPSRNPSPSPSNRSFHRPRSTIPSRDPSPGGRFANFAGSIRKKASDAIHAVPTRSKIRDEFRGPPSRSASPDEFRVPRDQSRSRSRSPMRPRSRIDMPEVYLGGGDDGLLRPEDIHVGPSYSGTTMSDVADNSGMGRGRTPIRKGTGMSQASGRSSPVSQMSVVSMGGALGLSRGGDSRDAAYVTYPNANTSAANLSMIAEEERVRQSNYNPTPSPNPRRGVPSQDPDFYPPRPPGSQRQYSDNSMREFNDHGSRYPPAPPSIRSQMSMQAPTPPVKSPRTASGSYPWTTRPVPSKITMPTLLSTQSPTPSSRGGMAGVGAGGGFHRRALSANPNFASPHPSARLSMAGSLAGSDRPPPVAPKPASRRTPIVLDDPPSEGNDFAPGHAPSRSWSGEKQQISRVVPSRSRANSNAMRPLGTVEERSPYIQQPGARRSTGSLISVNSRIQNDPAFAIESDLTATLEREFEAGVFLPRDEGPSRSVATKVGKRVSKVLKFGGNKKTK